MSAWSSGSMEVVMSGQRDVSRIAKAAQALRELTVEDLAILNQAGAISVLSSSLALSAVPAHDWTVEVHPDVRALLLANKKINAIKLQRELTTMALSEAKDFVEMILL